MWKEMQRKDGPEGGYLMRGVYEYLRLTLDQLKEIMKILKEIRDIMKNK